MPSQSGKLIATKSLKGKKITKSAKTVVTAINPDLYMASPRPGGVVKILPSLSQTNVKDVIDLEAKSLTHIKSFTSQTSTSVYYSTSRERRINLALKNSNRSLNIKNESDESEEFADNMLAITISCIMLVAAKVKNIPEEYMVFAERYLCCIKDDKNTHPPNVQGILNHIRHLLSKKSKKERHKLKDDLTFFTSAKSKRRPEKENTSKSKIPKKSKNKEVSIKEGTSAQQ